jgi:hypothetical protein
MVESGLQPKKNEGVLAFGYQKLPQSRGWIEFYKIGEREFPTQTAGQDLIKPNP